MDRYIFWIVMAAIFALQLLLCLKMKNTFSKLLPLIGILLFIIFSIISYAASGWSNWAFLILLLLLSMPLGAVGAGWLVFGIIKITKTALLSRKNT